MTLDQIKKVVKQQKIEFLLCSFVEMSGLSKAKLVPATHLDDVAADGAGFAGFATGHIGQGPHDPDIVSMPDFNSFAVVPWRRNTAWVTGNVHVEGQPWPYCPRTILRRQIAKARQLGFSLNVGVEPEFMLLRKLENGTYVLSDPLDVLTKPCYDLVTLHRSLDVMTTLIRYMQQLGWDPYACDHEDANCQFEINWRYADALTTADRQTFFRWMVKIVAEQLGLFATFMPKPFAHLTGSGAHYHLSLWDRANKKNLFLNPRDASGLSQLGYWFTGGVLKHARAVIAVAAPLVNSYKRLIRGAPLSGATWAPVYITYGGSNRTQMIRLPGPGRIEVRAVDGAANPYLTCAALLAAGLDGIAHKINPGPRNDDNLYQVPEAELRRRKIGFLPASLREAMDCLEEDPVIRDALGETYARYYIDIKREEWRLYHTSISQWELEHYLPIY